MERLHLTSLNPFYVLTDATNASVQQYEFSEGRLALPKNLYENSTIVRQYVRTVGSMFHLILGNRSHNDPSTLATDTDVNVKIDSLLHLVLRNHSLGNSSTPAINANAISVAVPAPAGWADIAVDVVGFELQLLLLLKVAMTEWLRATVYPSTSQAHMELAPSIY